MMFKAVALALAAVLSAHPAGGHHHHARHHHLPSAVAHQHTSPAHVRVHATGCPISVCGPTSGTGPGPVAR